MNESLGVLLIRATCVQFVLQPERQHKAQDWKLERPSGWVRRSAALVSRRQLQQVAEAS